jgi:hypothetical protein
MNVGTQGGEDDFMEAQQPSGDSEVDGLQSLRQLPEWKAAIEEAGPRIRLHLAKAGLDPAESEGLLEDLVVELLLRVFS